MKVEYAGELNRQCMPVKLFANRDIPANKKFFKEDEMAPQSYQLVMRSGPTPGKTIDLTQNEITIGRDIANDIVINDAEVSRKHARLISQAGSYVLEDVGSTNGTFVKGQRLMGPHLLRPGELILLGENVSLSFEQLQFDPDATMVAASNVPSMPPTPAPRDTYNSAPPERASPPAQRPAPSTRYEEQYPAGPAEAFPYQEEERRERKTWVYVGCGCLLVLLCLLIGGAVAFDQLNLYCVPPFDGFFACP